jgi:hypothetical protein
MPARSSELSRPRQGRSRSRKQQRAMACRWRNITIITTITTADPTTITTTTTIITTTTGAAIERGSSGAGRPVGPPFSLVSREGPLHSTRPEAVARRQHFATPPLTPRARERGRVALVVLRKPKERPHEQRSRIFPLSGRREQRCERVRVLNARGLADGLETAASGPYQEVPEATLRQTITALARTRLQDGAKAGPWRKKLSRVGALAGPQSADHRR